MIIKLIIDNRETELYNNIILRDLEVYNEKIKIEKRNLELGDIIIIIEDENNEEKKTYIFERKTLKDLNGSINDGRYKEQKNRLMCKYNINDITYIIEEDDIHKSINRSDKRITSVYLNTLYRDNIKIIFNKNIKETTTFILTLCVQIINNINKYLDNIENIKENYIDTIKIKSKKIENITPENCFILQLSQIPTISKTIAKNKVIKYSNIKELIKELEKYDEEENKIKKLQEIDKIGKEKAKKILEYMKL